MSSFLSAGIIAYIKEFIGDNGVGPNGYSMTLFQSLATSAGMLLYPMNLSVYCSTRNIDRMGSRTRSRELVHGFWRIWSRKSYHYINRHNVIHRTYLS